MSLDLTVLKLLKHRDRYERYQRLLHKRFPQGEASPADLGKLMSLNLGLCHERMVAEWCEEAIGALSALAHEPKVVPLESGLRENEG